MMLARWLQMSVHVLCTYEYTSFVCEIHPKGNQSWMFIGRTDAKATSILWPPHVKSWLIGKDPDAGRDWGQEEKGTTEDEMAGWPHWLNGHESEWTPGVGDGQGGLACCDSWGHKRVGHDWATELNWTMGWPGGGHGTPLQYSCLENPMDRRAWWAIVHGYGHKDQTWLK